MVCWRYRTIVFEFKKDGLFGDSFIDDEEVEKTLNEQGSAGWELVNATMVQDGLLALFKKPDPGTVSCKSEEEKNEVYRIDGKIVNTQMSNKSEVSGISKKEESGSLSHEKSIKISEKQSACLIGEIKIK